jgi:hypothetical protein
MVCVLVGLTLLNDWRQQIARRLAPLDVMIRHHHMDHIIRTPLRHMTTGAVAGLRVFP